MIHTTAMPMLLVLILREISHAPVPQAILEMGNSVMVTETNDL